MNSFYSEPEVIPTSSGNVYFTGALIAGIVLHLSSALPAFAEASVTELLVRLKNPQRISYSSWTQKLQVPGKREIVNAHRGILKFSFDSAEETERARALLRSSAEVASVTSNHLYRPAIRYRFVDASGASGRRSFFIPRQGPLAERLLVAGQAPEAELPSGEATEGEDPLAAQDWALEKIRMPPSDAELSGAESRIISAVIDTGVDYNHEDLIRAMWRSERDPREVGFDTVHEHARPFDRVYFDIEGCLKDFACRFGLDTSKHLVNPGHGTHCAGHLGAVVNNSLGIRGVGAGTKIMALKFFYDVGEKNAGSGDDAAAVKAIDYAIQNGAKVINASWGSRMGRAEAEKSELKAALVRARDAGVLVVVAAGNSALDQDSEDEPFFPAAFELDNLIVVAATDPKDGLAEFSNYGAQSVHIGAPGVRILSTTSGGSYNDLVARYKDDDGKEKEMVWEGTSMAAPFVAGAVAAVWTRKPEASYREIREIILSSARQVPGLDGQVSTGGVLDLAAALERASH